MSNIRDFGSRSWRSLAPPGTQGSPRKASTALSSAHSGRQASPPCGCPGRCRHRFAVRKQLVQSTSTSDPISGGIVIDGLPGSRASGGWS